MATIRAKMAYTSLTTTDYGNGYTQNKVRFEPRYDASIPEDKRFQKASPSGAIAGRLYCRCWWP